MKFNHGANPSPPRLREGSMFGLFRNRAQDALTARLYAGLNEAARRPALYLDHGVPDTVEGRYDMMVLHLFVLVQRLRAGSPQAQDIAQAVCDGVLGPMPFCSGSS